MINIPAFLQEFEGVKLVIFAFLLYNYVDPRFNAPIRKQ